MPECRAHRLDEVVRDRSELLNFGLMHALVGQVRDKILKVQSLVGLTVERLTHCLLRLSKGGNAPRRLIK
jgi:hypothetical protein